MKTIFSKTIVAVLILTSLILLNSCSKEFLERPPEDSPSSSEFYRTTAQIQGATNILYSVPWYEFISNVSWCIGDLAAGTGRTWDPRNQDFDLFAITGEHNTLGQAWNSLFAVIAHANTIINTVPENANADVPISVVNSAVGEARAMRAVAYFYLVRIFGSVPIIENNLELVDQNYIERHVVADIYTFIKNDLNYAIANISHNKATEPGRISSNGAKALLAKVHLTLEEYAEAYNLSTDVIASGEFKLLGGTAEDGIAGSYNDLFLTANDNNQESILATQWTGSGKYAEGNGVQSLYALGGITGFDDGWSAIGPSLDLQDTYEDKVVDQRYKATIMEPNSFYPNLNGGYTAPDPSGCNAQGTNVAIKKYVVGTPATNGGGDRSSYANNIYLLRYADVLLTQAEAIIRGNVGSMSEAETSLNKIRNRAGLASISNPDFEDVFKERKLEFALEMQHWYDAIRRDDALEYLSTRQRGWFNDTERGEVDGITDRFVQVSANKLLFPYPTNETLNNPALLDEPVPYFN
ncbi:RagB/SusD family nutrient uptake outer membrane protein [Maribacter sp. LLG6340-A2]|uniref:RagB/SusD family nutrient uptake outer membrane protein n=1 Tax=Maribacter sp. LLG6340-A2 TaxID=3160834 RepID=UPI0038709A4D